MTDRYEGDEGDSAVRTSSPESPADWDEDTLLHRFELYGALWLFCSQYHSGQSSRGYRILSRLSRAGYSPGLSLQQNEFESDEQRELYDELVRNHSQTV